MFNIHKTDNSNDCIIINGEVKQVESQILNNEVKQVDELDNNEVKQVDELDNLEDQPVSTQLCHNSIQTLPVLNNYMPSYLINTMYGSDYGLFLDYCQTALKYSPRYLQDVLMNLNFWRKHLINTDASQLSIESIKSILKNCTVTRQHQLMQTLRRYSEYRDFHGDHRLLVLIARAKLKRPIRKNTSKTSPTLSLNEFQNYWKFAQSLCADLDRVGIWMCCCCLGIKCSEIKGLQSDNDHLIVTRKGTPLTIKKPPWLSKAFDSVPASHWRHSRQNILKGITAYGTKPVFLYNASKLYPVTGK